MVPNEAVIFSFRAVGTLLAPFGARPLPDVL
jgi:hypothetical protein